MYFENQSTSEIDKSDDEETCPHEKVKDMSEPSISDGEFEIEEEVESKSDDDQMEISDYDPLLNEEIDETIQERERLSILEEDSEEQSFDIVFDEHEQNNNLVQDEPPNIENGLQEIFDEVNHCDGHPNPHDHCGHSNPDDPSHFKKKKKNKTERKRKKSIKCRSTKIIPKSFMCNRSIGDLSAGLMAHDPCGPEFPKGDTRRCWSHGTCEKKFPRKQEDVTDPTIEGYPYYRRREYLDPSMDYEMPGRYKMINGDKIRISNPWIPAYNAPMLLRYRYHQNVECSEGMSCMSYLFEYIYKGQDVAHVEFKEYEKTEDEIKLHKYGRVLSSDETAWNILGFGNSEIKPTIKRLGFFVPGDKYIRVQSGEVPKQEDVDRQRRETEFYSYFERNKLEYEIRDKFNRMMDQCEDPQKIVDTINSDLNFEMFYVDKKGKIQQWFDWEYPKSETEKFLREEQGKPEPKLPWAFELTCKYSIFIYKSFL